MPLANVSRTDAHPDSAAQSTLSSAAAAHAAGNALFVIINGGSSSFTANLTDTAGNSYSAVGTGTDGTSFYALYKAYNIVGHAANVVQASLSASQIYPAMVVHEASGFGTSEPSVTTGFGNGTTDGSANATSSLSFAGEGYVFTLFICGFDDGSQTAHAGGTAFNFGEDAGDMVDYWTDVHHVATGPHNCVLNYGTGTGQAYRWGGMAAVVGVGGGGNVVLLGQAVM